MWIVCTATFVNRAGVMVIPFMVLYVTKQLGVAASVAGLALTVYGVGGLISGPVAGRLCDRIGPLTVLRGSLILSGAMLLAFPLVHRFSSFLVVTFFWSLLAEAVRPATLTALTGAVEPERRKAAVALNRLAINLGMTIGPAIGGFLATASMPLLFIVDGATSFVSGIVLWSLLEWRRDVQRLDEPPVARAARASDARAVVGAVVHRDGHALVFFFGILLVSFVFIQHEAALPVFLVRELGYRESFYGMLFAVNTLLIVAIEVPLNLAMQDWPHHRAMMLGAFLNAVGFGSLAIARTPASLVLAAVIWTFGEMITFPVSGAYAADIAPPGRAGEYVGAYASMFSLSMLVAPWAGTALLDRLGSMATWAIAFGVGLSSVIVLGTTKRSRAPIASRRASALGDG